MAATLLLVRHGHTAGNDGSAPVLMGGATDLPLDGRGEREAARVAARLAGERRSPWVYASPLLRARSTAEAIAGGRRRVLCVDALREIDCGALEGLPLREVQERFPDAWARNERQADPDLAWPGGESYRAFRDRCVAGAAAIARDHPGERTLVVTHAGVIGQLVGAALGTSPARWSDHRPGNASLTVLTWSRGRVAVVSFDDRAHLIDERC